MLLNLKFGIEDVLPLRVLPVPVRGLQIAWKDTATDPVLEAVTV